VPRRDRERHPEQAQRVEGGVRGLARHDGQLKKMEHYLFEAALETRTPVEIFDRRRCYACCFLLARSALTFAFIFTLRLRCFCETLKPFLFIVVFSL
jgi:hypothetical protein